MDNANTPKHPLIELAEQYYAVADDLQRNAIRQSEVANSLRIAADKYCEQASRETKHD